MQLNLYTTQGCHLCEKALGLLEQARAAGYDLHIREIEIADSATLMEKYGIRIPVVTRDDEARELGWPFGYEELLLFITTRE